MSYSPEPSTFSELVFPNCLAPGRRNLFFRPDHWIPRQKRHMLTTGNVYNPQICLKTDDMYFAYT